MKKYESLRNRHVLLAVFLFLVVFAELYIVEYLMYAHAVQTVFVYAAVYPPVIVILYMIFGKRPPKKVLTEEMKKIRRTIVYVVLVAFAGFTYIYVLTSSRERLSSWQLLAVVTALVIISIRYRLRRVDAVTGLEAGADFKVDINFKADAVSIIYVLLALVTMLFLLITRPYTVTAAREKLEETGYRNIVFVAHYLTATDAPDESDPSGDEMQPGDANAPIDKAGHYGLYSFFDATRNEYVYIDVASGEIL